MESKAESTPVQQITIDFYGNQEYLEQDLLEFMNLFPKDLYRGIDEYWDHFLDKSFVKKQLSMIEFCKEINEDKNSIILQERQQEKLVLLGDSSYYLITANKFSLSKTIVNHPSFLLKKPNISFNTFNVSNDFSSSFFYTTRPFLKGKGIMLTNSANANLDFVGEEGSTTKSLKILNDNHFFTTCKEIYQPSDEMLAALHGIPLNDNQVIKPQCINSASTVSFPAGTVFKNENVLELSIKFRMPDVDTNIKGVYHIKGINWNLVNEEEKKLERQISNINFVKKYYNEILYDFDESRVDVLCLEKIPEDFYLQGTELGLVQAVSTFNLSEEQHIIVGMSRPVPMWKLPPKFMLWYNLLTYKN